MIVHPDLINFFALKLILIRHSKKWKKLFCFPPPKKINFFVQYDADSQIVVN